MNPSPMRQLASATAAFEITTRANEFATFCRYIAAYGGKRDNAMLAAEADHVLPRTLEIFKSAVNAGTLGDATNAAPIAPLPAVVAFMESLRSVGVFDAMLPSMRRVPLRCKVAIATGGITGSTVGDGMVKPISKLTLGSNSIDEYKAVAIVVASTELLRFSNNDVANIFAQELRQAVALTTDQQFISLITTGISPITSNGGTAVAIRQDLSAALAAMSIDASSRLFVLVESATAKHWATQTDSTGQAAFPEMGPLGGRACGMDVLVADGLSANSIVVVDAYQMCAAAGTVVVDGSRNATLSFDTAPDSPPGASSVLASLFQQGQSALRAERLFAAQRQRDTAVAVIGSVSYTGNSPN